MARREGSHTSAADRGTASLAGRVIRQSKDKPARWMAPRKLPNCRRMVFSEGRIAASIQLFAVGRRPRWSTNSRREATASSSLASASSEIGTASPSNTPGGFVLWELRSTPTTSGIRQPEHRVCHLARVRRRVLRALRGDHRSRDIRIGCSRFLDAMNKRARRKQLVPEPVALTTRIRPESVPSMRTRSRRSGSSAMHRSGSLRRSGLDERLLPR